MPVVKAQKPGVMRQSAIVMDLSDLEQEGAKIVAEAQRQAQQIVEQARVQAQREGEEIRTQSRQEGQTEGYRQGFEQGQKTGHDETVVKAQTRLDQLADAWIVTLQEFQQNMPTHMAQVKTDLVRLALAIAQRVTRQEALANRRVTENNVAAALALVSAGRSVTLHVHPDEAQAIETYLPRLLAELRGVSHVEIAAADNITPGGCLLRFGTGQIDATLETQVQRIADELLMGQEATEQKNNASMPQ